MREEQHTTFYRYPDCNFSPLVIRMVRIVIRQGRYILEYQSGFLK